MVPKQIAERQIKSSSFRAVLFRMVPKLSILILGTITSFRAVLFRMVPKLLM